MLFRESHTFSNVYAGLVTLIYEAAVFFLPLPERHQATEKKRSEIKKIRFNVTLCVCNPVMHIIDQPCRYKEGFWRYLGFFLSEFEVKATVERTLTRSE